VAEIQLASADAVADDGGETTAVVEDFSIHRQGGLISIYATQTQHELVQNYLLELMEQVGSQVVIEAKILEVNLKDEFRSGVDWTAITDILLGRGITFDIDVGLGNVNSNQQDFVQFSYLDGDQINGIVDLISEFGTTRTLANPRLAISNNQTALLKVAQNQVYFTFEVDNETTEFGTTQTITSSINTVPIGLVMLVQPSIDLGTDTVSLNLRPSLSRIIGFVNDPGVAIASNNTVQSSIPITEIREFDSVVSSRSGDVVILGGLMQEVNQNNDVGLPLAQDIPWAGEIFKSNDDDREVTELVVFLRATIVKQPLPDPADIDLYSTFSIDPRPLTF